MPQQVTGFLIKIEVYQEDLQPFNKNHKEI